MPLIKINNHAMYYEVIGSGDPVICSGGWGTFCHGASNKLPRGLTDQYSVVIYDHRGIGESDDNLNEPSTTKIYAQDVIGLVSHLCIDHAHFVGIIGIGACIFQEVAIQRPDLVRSLVNTGTWALPDVKFADQLKFWLDVHREMGFEAFQRMLVLESFSQEFYVKNKDKLLGPEGAWSELNGNIQAHQRLTEASLSHNTLDRLEKVTAPALVMHNGRDSITAPRLTVPVEEKIPGARGHWMPRATHVATGREARKEFCDVLLGFLAAH